MRTTTISASSSCQFVASLSQAKNHPNTPANTAKTKRIEEDRGGATPKSPRKSPPHPRKNLVFSAKPPLLSARHPFSMQKSCALNVTPYFSLPTPPSRMGGWAGALGEV
jgi:hypothetical protein